ncbi:MAG: PEP-CTERM sorting domain-containing protein, partial [Planctomycetes bacterium]|nr:PEP-CTERM sorting domain-containing protein [Planctomycetota bacterium]
PGMFPIPAAYATGHASASFTLTDFDAGSATLTGIGDTGGGYLAQYNGWAGDPFGGPQGTTFAEGIFAMSAGFLETVTEDFVHPETAIGETVNDMSSLVSFTLSAQDLASGTSSYVIVPEPGALTLLALGAVALLRRR